MTNPGRLLIPATRRSFSSGCPLVRTRCCWSWRTRRTGRSRTPPKWWSSPFLLRRRRTNYRIDQPMRRILLTAFTVTGLARGLAAQVPKPTKELMNFNTADVAGLRLFYREAGDPSKPTIVLLHGFPSSSFQFHDLIPLLADRFRVIAPDYPGMGYSEAPDPTILRPTFDDVAMVIDTFIAQCASGPVILYMQDIGGPIGMRIATAHPERIAGLIFQNFTISVEGWNPERLKVYERLGGPEAPEKLAETEQFATVERSRFLHQTGARRPDALNPDNWAMDAYACSIPASRVF